MSEVGAGISAISLWGTQPRARANFSYMYRLARYSYIHTRVIGCINCKLFNSYPVLALSVEIVHKVDKVYIIIIIYWPIQKAFL